MPGLVPPTPTHPNPEPASTRSWRTRESVAGRSVFAHLGRHQIASVLSTAVDFGVMVIAVELLGRSPVVGTIAGASCGAISNFQLGRHFTFGALGDHIGPQALRYALVSGASAGLNALGEYGVHDGLGVQYFAARALVAVAVSLLWNFPLQRHFVFRQSSKDRA
jgi:putative flippase GtrA